MAQISLGLNRWIIQLGIIFVLSVYLQAQQKAVVDAHWLTQRLHDKEIVIVDLRNKEIFAQEHILNAVNIPAYENLFADNYMMPGLDELREIFSQAGINSQSFVVAYDDGSFIWSARLYWILETLGHTNVALLNVGFDSWKHNSLPTSNQSKVAIRKDFVPRVDNTKLETKLGTMVAIGNKTIIDGRKNSHYLGEESYAKRFGHIPTAQNYACTQNYEVTQTGNKMKEFSALEKIYENLPKEKEIILYCDGGAEAALNYVVLKELGYKVSVYDGSWIEWGNDMNVPIENPSQSK